MMLNYHELTMTENRKAPGRSNQKLVILIIGAGVMLSALLKGGCFSPMEISHGSFPGGEFVFKTVAKDYTAQMGAIRRLTSEIELTGDQEVDYLYTMLIDEESKVPAGKMRYFVGAISPPSEQKATLLNHNRVLKEMGDDYKMEFDDTYWGVIPYEEGKLPKGAKTAVVHFPFTNGFISALILSYKIVPRLTKYAKEMGVDAPLIATTCSIEQQMCTHYAPLEKINKFTQGKPDTETYARILEEKKQAEKKGQDEL